MKPIRSHIFCSKRWRIEWKKMRVNAGECEAPHERDKTIRLDPRLTERQLLEVIIHEGLHACQWQLSEESVTETARDISRLLWRLVKAGRP